MRINYLLASIIFIFYANSARSAIVKEPIIEKITFIGSDSLPLGGTLYLPQGKVDKIVIMLNAVIYDGREHPNFTATGDTLSYDRYIIQHFLDHQIGTLLIETKQSANPRHPPQSTRSYAADADNAYRYLKLQDRFKNIPTGIWGSSAAGCSAAMVAAQNRDIAFLLLVSVPSTNGIALDKYYFTSPPCDNNRLLAMLGPLQSAMLDATFRYNNAQYPKDVFVWKVVDSYDRINQEIVSRNENIDTIYIKGGKLLKSIFEGIKFKIVEDSPFGKPIPTLQYMDSIIKLRYSPSQLEIVKENRPLGKPIPALQYMDSIIKYQYPPYQIEMVKWNPEKVYPTIACPTLMLFGKKDVNINLEASVTEVHRIIKNNELNNFTVKQYERLNHSLTDFERIRRREIPIEVFEDIFKWIDEN